MSARKLPGLINPSSVWGDSQNPEDSTTAPNHSSGGIGKNQNGEIDQEINQAAEINQKESAESAAYRHRVNIMSQDISVAGRARRERLASEIMVQLSAGTHFMVGSDGRMDITPNPEGTAFVAVYLADALIARLDAPPQEGAK